MTETLTIEFDGGSRGNPGPAAVGIVVRAADGTPLATIGRFIGNATNNVAEYKALIGGLQEAKKLTATRVLVRGDSELIIRQMTGVYRVKNPDLKMLHAEATSLVKQFEQVKFEHNLRHKNELADKLANRAMDKKGEVLDVDDVPDSPKAAASAPRSALQAGETFSCDNCGCKITIDSPPHERVPQRGPFVCVCGHRFNRDATK